MKKKVEFGTYFKVIALGLVCVVATCFAYVYKVVECGAWNNPWAWVAGVCIEVGFAFMALLMILGQMFEDGLFDEETEDLVLSLFIFCQG